MVALHACSNASAETKLGLRIRDKAGGLGPVVTVIIIMAKPDPELLPIQRPRCLKCSMRVIATDVTPTPCGFEHRTFECLKCGHSETRRLAADPVKTHAADGWLKGELGQSAEE